MPAGSTKPVIVVAIGYRLGGLGFMAMPELTAESAHHSSGNYGLLDQIFAVEWIKRNIASFGASSTPNVVVFGESAGAYDISVLLASPLAANLFDGAIMESTYQAFYWKSLAVSEKTGSFCATMHHCDNATDKLGCMRALPAGDAYNCQALTLGTVSNYMQILETPNVDGSVRFLTPSLVLRLESHLQPITNHQSHRAATLYCATHLKHCRCVCVCRERERWVGRWWKHCRCMW